MKFNPKNLVRNREYCESLFMHYIKIKSLRHSPLDYRKHLNKSFSNLDLANFLLEEHNHSIKEKLPQRKYYDWCITIYYYAIYHTALALLSKAGYKSGSHFATLTAITLFYYHKNNFLNKNEINLLIEKISISEQEIYLVIDSKELRQRASYGADDSFNLSAAKILRAQAADFINSIKMRLLA